MCRGVGGRWGWMRFLAAIMSRIVGGSMCVCWCGGLSVYAAVGSSCLRVRAHPPGVRRRRHRDSAFFGLFSVLGSFSGCFGDGGWWRLVGVGLWVCVFFFLGWCV